MTMRHTLLLLAATTAPLYAQQEAPAADPAQEAPAVQQTPPELQAPAPEAPDSQLAQRIKALPPLALMPAGVDAFLSTGNLSPILRPFLPVTLPSHVSMAFGSSGNTVEFLLDFLTAANSTVENSVNKMLESAAVFKDQSIAPAYLVLNADGSEAGGELADLVRAIANSPETAPYCTPASVNGFEGVQINLEALIRNAIEEENPEGFTFTPQAQAALDSLKGRSLYMMSRAEGMSQVLIMTEDPASVKVAASPAESLLSTDKVAEADSTPQGLILLSYLPPEISAKINKTAAVDLTNRLTQLITPLLIADSTASEADGEAIQKALQGMEQLKQAYLGLFPETVTHPYTVKCWFDGDLHFENKTDAGNFSYEPGTLRLSQLAQNPMTALYAEGTACTVEGMPSAKALLTACEQLFTGITVSGQLESLGVNTAEWKQGLALYQMFKPQILKLAEGLGIMGSGLGNSSALVVKAQPDPMIPAAAAYYAPVTNRAKLTEGWKMVLDTVTTATVAFGGNPEILSMLPITEQEIPGGNAYTVALPTNTPACTPSFQVTDGALVIGSTPELSTELMQTATGTTPFSGSLVTINFEPVALIARSIATHLRANCPPPAEEYLEDEPSLNNDAEADEEDADADEADDTSDDDFAGDDFADDYDGYVEPSKEEEAAEQAEEIASALEYAAIYIQSLQMTNGVKDGQIIIRTDIILRK